MSSFWSYFIIILVVVSVIGYILLLRWTMHMHTDEEQSDDESTGHIWDNDLKENNSPLPKWWLNTFYLSIVFSAGYLVLYPGMGNFAGILGWTQTGQYDAEVIASNEKFSAIYAAFVDQSPEQLLSNPAALEIGRNTFMNYCAQCHGSDARGAKSFPNLTDDAWLYGGDAQAIETTIRNGRIGNMPALGAVAGKEGTEQIIDWLLGDLDAGSAQEAAAKNKFLMSSCAGCHGPEAAGNPMLGAPNLRDGIWLHGSSREDIRATINNGRVNQMPAQLDLIGEDRVKLVTAYVMSLNKDN
jgi:cytochrome c oxidase cbb3-type subunit 3